MINQLKFLLILFLFSLMLLDGLRMSLSSPQTSSSIPPLQPPTSTSSTLSSPPLSSPSLSSSSSSSIGQVFVCTNKLCKEKGSDATMATFTFLTPSNIPVVGVNC